MYNLRDWEEASSHFPASTLGRVRRKSPVKPANERRTGDADEAPRSPTTEHHIQTFLDAAHLGDKAEQSRLLGKIVEAWRADNAAGGVPVYAHAPLPKSFADDLAQMVKSTAPAGELAKSADIVARLEPGARASVLQQIGNAVTRAGFFEHPVQVGKPESERKQDRADRLRFLHNEPQHPHLTSPPDSRDRE